VTSSRHPLSLVALVLVTAGAYLATLPAEPPRRSPSETSSDATSSTEGQVEPDFPPILDEPESFVEADTPYGAWLGVELAYQVKFESTVNVESGDVTQSIHHAFSGSQIVKIVERTHESATATYTWPGIKLDLVEDGIYASLEETQALTRELAQPVLVYYDLEGRQQALRFTTGVSATTRNWVRTLVSSQHCPVPEVPPLAFDLVEADASGLSLVHYVVTDLSKDEARVSRNKIEALDGIAWRDGIKAPVVSGEGFITLSSGWTLGVDWREQSTLELEEADLRVHKDFIAKIDRVSLKHVALETLRDGDFESEWRALDGLSEAIEHPNQSPAGLEPALISEADAPTVLSYLVSLERSHDHSANVMLAVDRLTFLITEDPATLQLLRSRITSGEFPEWTASKVLGAVAAAGHKSSQELLCSLFYAPDSPSALLGAVTLALSQLNDPSTETIDFFWKKITDDANSSEIRHSSWRLLGLFANTDSDPLLRAKLIGMEAKAIEIGELIPWLEALGNTRSPEAFSAIQEHLSSENEDVRTAAVKALRGLDLLEVNQALIKLGGTDESAAIRSEALALLSKRDGSEVIQALSRLLRDEPEVAVRRSALERLAQRPLNGDLIVLLSIVITSDPEIMLRAYALTLLGG
jgi:HEAT repeat protein